MSEQIPVIYAINGVWIALGLFLMIYWAYWWITRR